MQLTIEIPDELVAALASGGSDPARAALEAIGLEAYREEHDVAAIRAFGASESPKRNA